MSYSNNPRSIIAGAGIIVTPTTGTGANTITISSTSTSTQIVAVRIDTSTTVAILTSDYIVSVEPVSTVTAVAISLPAGVTGQVFNIKDGNGTATPVRPYTITPAAGTIDGAATAVINAPFGSVTLVYDSIQWLIL